VRQPVVFLWLYRWGWKRRREHFEPVHNTLHHTAKDDIFQQRYLAIFRSWELYAYV